MIRVRCLGHIATGAGAKEFTFDRERLTAAEVVELVRYASGKQDPGFSKYNTLVLVEDGEALSPTFASGLINSGESVVLVPVSHGG